MVLFMLRRDLGDDPVLDANDTVWWCGLAVLAIVPMLVTDFMGWPLWAGLPVAVVVGFVSIPAQRRYRRRLEANRPSARLPDDKR